MNIQNEASSEVTVPLIRYPRFKELHQEIRLCLRKSKLAGEPQCMSLEGITGAGKSTLITDYAAQFPRYETADGTMVPVFYAETPSPVTEKGMASHLLRMLGDPAAYKGTQPALNSRLIDLIKDCEVTLVILDDFHHLIDKKTNRVLHSVSEWLKVLIKETRTMYLVVGIEGEVETILDANQQLGRLFAARHTLEPFSWDPAKVSTIKEFAAFIKYAERARIPITKSVPRMELLFRIYYATNGVVANIMNLMNLSAVLSGDRGQKEIDPGILSLAFQKRLAKHIKGKVNPFEVDWTTRFVPPQQGRQRGHGAIGDVLTTK